MEKQGIGKMAAKLASKAVPTQEQTNQFARTAGMFTKHVVGSTVKPLHTLWHEVLGFIFLAFSGLGAWKLFSSEKKLELPQFLIAVIFIGVVGAYGASSVMKARRIAGKRFFRKNK